MTDRSLRFFLVICCAAPLLLATASSRAQTPTAVQATAQPMPQPEAQTSAQTATAPALATDSSHSSSPQSSRGSLQDLYDRVTPSLVAVKFDFNYEFGRIECVGAGVVVSDDGLVLVPGEIINDNFPNEQLKDFKIIIPGNDSAGGKDDEELDAEFQGRDEADGVSFVKVKGGQPHKWTPIKFVDEPLSVGEPVYAVGMLAKTAGYRTFLNTATIAAHIRGDIPQILVSGALSNIGAPVFDADGNAIGLVNASLYDPYLSRTGAQQSMNAMAPIITPPRLFTASSEFADGISHPPTPGHPEQIPWVGLPQMVGLTKDVADAFGLANQPAIQIGAVVPDSPAAAAGLKVGQIVVKMNGKPLTRGDQPDELPLILQRQTMRMHVGEKVTFSVLSKKGETPHDITVTLGQRPPQPNAVKRYYADDLGFGVRQITFDDTFRRNKPANFPGVVVTILKPAGAAQNAKLSGGDIITQIDNDPVNSLDGFIHDYQTIRADKPKEAIVLVTLNNDGATQTIRIEPPQ